MTASQMMLLASSAQQIRSSIISTVGDTRAAPTVANASFGLNSNGTTFLSGNTTSGQSTWITFPPPLSSYWASMTVNSGNANNGGPTSGTIVALSSSPGWSWTCPANAVRSANCTLRVYADAAGTQLLSTSNFTVSLEST